MTSVVMVKGWNDMARYIDADALKERLFAISVVSDDLYGMGINRGLDRAETAIDMMPTADVAPRAEVAREIFEEIENDYADFLFDGYRNIIVLTDKDFNKLKKKYTEGKYENQN